MITTPRKNITVAIADDHTMVRTALANLITTRTNYKVCIEAGNGEDLLEQLDRAGLPDIILLDINMPVMDGIGTMIRLKEKYEDPVVIALTGFSDYSAIRRMVALGIKGCLSKTQVPEDMFYTIDTVASNGEYLTAEVNDKLHISKDSSTYKKIAGLKEKELILLQYLCEGMTYKKIAHKMRKSPYTVEDYRSALFQKLEVKSKTELILFALEHKLVKHRD